MGRTRERSTAVAMPAVPADGWTVLYDVAWPGRRRMVIDHVVAGPPGVFVLTTESWSGRVVLEDGELRHEGRNRIDALRHAVAAAAAVASVWPGEPPAPVHAVLHLTGADRPSAWLGCVTVCSTEAMVPALTALPRALSDEQARIIVSDLRWLLRGAGESRSPALSPYPRSAARAR